MKARIYCTAAACIFYSLAAGAIGAAGKILLQSAFSRHHLQSLLDVRIMNILCIRTLDHSDHCNPPKGRRSTEGFHLVHRMNLSPGIPTRTRTGRLIRSLVTDTTLSMDFFRSLSREI